MRPQNRQSFDARRGETKHWPAPYFRPSTKHSPAKRPAGQPDILHRDYNGIRLRREQAITFIQSALADAAQEALMVIYLDGDLKLLGATRVGKGSLSGVEIKLGEILREGFAIDAAGFLLVHNHPCGDPTPTNDDIAKIRKIRTMLEELNMPLLDYLAVAEDRVFSVAR